MKILVTYFSQTGNTEKIALAIHSEVAKEYDAILTNHDEMDLESIHDYDFLFVDSPVHAGRISKEMEMFLSGLPIMAGKNLAGFITHAATAYPKQDLSQMTQPFEDACRDKKLEYNGCFSCQGYLADFMHDAVQKMKQVDDAEWAEMKERMTGHPNADDKANAMAFARSVLI